MKRQLLRSGVAIGALIGVHGLGAAEAAEPVKLSVGGFFKEAYMVVVDDNEEGDLGFDRNTDGFFNDAEIHFTGSTVLDNGLEVGARVELEGESEGDEDGDQIDEAWVWFAGGWGEVRIGSEDEALTNACVVPPGGTGNFSAFSPNQWGANAGGLFAFGGVFISNSVCAGVDERSDAQKIVYITPSFGGFQLTASYTPNPDAETHGDGVGPHLGMPASSPIVADAAVSAYVTYSYEGEDWGVTAGAGGAWEINIDGVPGALDAEEQDFYQAGVNLSIGNFGIGVVGEYYNDSRNFSTGPLAIEVDTWVAGIGASYQIDAWSFGLQYSHRKDETLLEGFLDDFDATQDRVVATANYALGPGINLDAEIGYTWVDTNPEVEDFATGSAAGLDDYQAFEFGIGTVITF